MSTAEVAIVSLSAVVIVIVICLAYIRVREGSDRSDERTADTRADEARERRGADATEAAAVRKDAAIERDRRAAESE